MNSTETLPVLNRLFSLLCRSLPVYVADVKATVWSEGERIRMSLDRMVADQRMYAHRVSDAITDRGGRPNPGRFPTEFTAKNDLSLVFLLPQMVDAQREMVGEIERCVEQVEGESALHALADEILGNAKGHLDILAELMKGKNG